MNVNTLSYTRSCLYQHTRGRNLTFRGSSLSRIKSDTSNTKEVKETLKILDEQAVKTELLQNTSDSGHNGETDFNRDENEADTNTQIHTRTRYLSRRTKAKVRDKALAFIHTMRDSNTTINFLTLTFINRTTDEQAHKILNKFLTTLRKHHPSLSYLWVAERQEGSKNKFGFGTGNIHYHMLINVWLDIPYFNSLWCICQYNEGVENDIANTNTAAKSTSIRQLFNTKQYKQIQAYLNPLDIDRIKNMKGCATYLTKYITKNTGEFTSQVWHCSRSVSRLATAQLKDKAIHALLLDEKYNTYVTKDGRILTPQEFETKDSKGNVIAKTVFIQQIDKVHKEHLQELNAINRFLLDLDINKFPDTIHSSILYEFNLQDFAFSKS